MAEGQVFTAADKALYEDQGFFSPLTLMGPEEMAGHRRALEAAEARLGPLHYKTKPYLLFSSPNVLARHPVLLDAVEALIGPDILLWDSAYVIKEPHSKGRVSWHQDLTYWGLDSDRLVTAWVAIADATPENGCMMMLPGSHKLGKQAHRDIRAEDNILHRGQTLEREFREEEVVRTPLKAGQASLHHGWTMHASNPNGSDSRRIGLTFQYAATSLRQTVIANETATLVRGRDDYGHFEPEPVFEWDYDPAMIAYREELERRKHAVYDAAP
jgi:hypothetical protein